LPLLVLQCSTYAAAPCVWVGPVLWWGHAAHAATHARCRHLPRCCCVGGAWGVPGEQADTTTAGSTPASGREQLLQHARHSRVLELGLLRRLRGGLYCPQDRGCGHVPNARSVDTRVSTHNTLVKARGSDHVMPSHDSFTAVGVSCRAFVGPAGDAGPHLCAEPCTARWCGKYLDSWQRCLLAPGAAVRCGAVSWL
jgi:hypothetical protein